jgi:hypothetical protein
MGLEVEPLELEVEPLELGLVRLVPGHSCRQIGVVGDVAVAVDSRRASLTHVGVGEVMGTAKKLSVGRLALVHVFFFFFFSCLRCPAEELNDGGGLPLVRTPVASQKEKNTAGEGGQRSLRLYDFNLFHAEGACEIN